MKKQRVLTDLREKSHREWFCLALVGKPSFLYIWDPGSCPLTSHVGALMGGQADSGLWQPRVYGLVELKGISVSGSVSSIFWGAFWAPET